MQVGEWRKADSMGGAGIRAGHAANFTTQRVRNDCAVSRVVKLEDAGAAAEDTYPAADAEAAINCWIP